MFGSSPFGSTTFGGNSNDSASVESSKLPFSSKDFLPEQLRDLELYKGLTSLIDYVISNYHIEEMNRLASLYDAFSTDFSPDQLINLLGGAPFFVKSLTDSQKRSMVLMLSNLYEIKGLKKGIEGILGLVGFPAIVYESWDVADEVETREPRRQVRWNKETKSAEILPPLFNSPIWDEYIDTCNIAVAFDITGKVVLENIDLEIRKVIESIVWVCTEIQEYVWIQDYSAPGRTDFSFPPSDSVVYEEVLNMCSKLVWAGQDPGLCLLNRPIIESEDTPIEDRVLAIFTEGPPQYSTFAERVWESPTFDQFILVDWVSLGGAYATRWTPQNSWTFANQKASISYLRSSLSDLPAPLLFYTVNKNEGPLNRTLIASHVRTVFEVETEYSVVLQVFAFAEVDGVTMSIEDIVAGAIKTPADFPEFAILSDNMGDSEAAFVPLTTSLFSFPPGKFTVDLGPLSVFNRPMNLIIVAQNTGVVGPVVLEISEFRTTNYDFFDYVLDPHPNYIPFLEYFTEEPLSSSFLEKTGGIIDQAENRFVLPIPDLTRGLQVSLSTYPEIPELSSSSFYIVDVQNLIDGTSSFKLASVKDGPVVDFSGSNTQLNEDSTLELHFITRSKKQLGTANPLRVGWNPFSSMKIHGIDKLDFFRIENNLGNQEIEFSLGPLFKSATYHLTPLTPKSETLNTDGTEFYGIIKVELDIEIIQGAGQVQFTSTKVKNDMIVQEVQSTGAVKFYDTPGNYSYVHPSPGYLTVRDQMIGLSFIASDLPIPVLEGDDSDFWNVAESKIKTPDQLSNGTEVQFIFSQLKTPSGLSDKKKYFVINAVWDGFYTVFKVSETLGGPAIIFGECGEDVTFSVYVLFKAKVTNLTVTSDSDVFFTGSFTFEENLGVPTNDPEYWAVHPDSDFWKVACEAEEFCCPDVINEDTFPLEIGNDPATTDLYSASETVVLSDWDMAIETNEITLDEILDYTGVPGSSLLEVSFDWAVGTQIRVRLERDTEGDILPGNTLPSATGLTFSEDDVYYVIPYDNPSPGVWRIHLATSHANALLGTFILFSGNAGPDSFIIEGSQLPPSFRENLP